MAGRHRGDGRGRVLIDCAPLQPAREPTTRPGPRRQTLLTDGPAAEIKEQFGGYTLAECADLDEALKWAATMPAASDGMVEVRPVSRWWLPLISRPPDRRSTSSSAPTGGPRSPP